ncbi:hypothetical protein [Burkholderia cepacia]|uniref:hypothetical protein n=1 Tax=Burkholderia cepacia TaxID=292 RepID=UPI002FE1B491
MTVRMRRRRIARCVPQRVTGKVASRLWDAGLRRTLKKRRGMDEISFKEAADEAGDEACASGAAFSPDAAIH